MAAVWGSPITLTPIVQTDPLVQVFTTSVELMSGETAGIEVTRTDAFLEEWSVYVQTSIDGIVYGTNNQPPRILGPTVPVINIPQDSVGVKFWRVLVGNGSGTPTKLIAATIRYVLDGVQL